MGNFILLLARYFLSGNALSRLNELNADNSTTMHIDQTLSKNKREDDLLKKIF